MAAMSQVRSVVIKFAINKMTEKHMTRQRVQFNAELASLEEQLIARRTYMEEQIFTM